MADDTDSRWLKRRLFDENVKSFFSAWDLYLKFYTVFFTVNVAGIGLLVQHVPQDRRLIIVLTFIGQNILAGGTAYHLTGFGHAVDDRLRALATALSADAAKGEDLLPLEKSPLPEMVARYGAWANVVGHVLLSASWFATLFVSGPGRP